MTTRHLVHAVATALGWGWGCSCGRQGSGTYSRSQQAALAHANRHVVHAIRKETAAANAAWWAEHKHKRDAQ